VERGNTLKLQFPSITSRLIVVLVIAIITFTAVGLIAMIITDRRLIRERADSSLVSTSSMFVRLAENYIESGLSQNNPDRFIEDLKRLTEAEFTFLRPAKHSLPQTREQGALLTPAYALVLKEVLDVVSSTLPDPLSHQLRDSIKQLNKDTLGTHFEATLGGQAYLTRLIHFNIAPDQAIVIVIQKPLISGAEISYAMILVGGLALFGALFIIMVAFFLGRNITQPVKRLIGAAQAVQEGGQHWVGMAYLSKSLSLERKDELGKLAAAFNRMVRILQEKEQMQDLLGKVVSREIAKELLDHDIELGGEEKQVTVLFLDIRNFTGLSEGHSPKRVLSMLNTCLTEASQIIEQNHGVVDKYVGDSVMALYGAPLATKEDANNAVATALAIEQSLDTLNVKLSQDSFDTIRIGVGISTGTVVAGNMGSINRLNYSVIGDNVNTASRLEELTKYYRTWVIVNDTTRKAADHYLYRMIDRVRVRGKKQSIAICQPLCHRDKLDESVRTLVGIHQQAIDAYSNQEWSQAINLFTKLKGLDSKTPLYPMYIDRCEHLQANPPGGEWDGVFDNGDNSHESQRIDVSISKKETGQGEKCQPCPSD